MSEASPDLPKLPLSTYIRRMKVYDELATGKKTPYKKLASKYDVSVRTIKEDVRWIRATFDLTVLTKVAIEKVIWALEQEKDPHVLLRYGLPFLSKHIAQKVQAEVEGSLVIKAWDLGNVKGSPS